MAHLRICVLYFDLLSLYLITLGICAPAFDRQMAYEHLETELKSVVSQNQLNFLKVKFINAKEEVHKLENEKGAMAERESRTQERAWLELIRQQIEDYEQENFPQPYDDDYNSKKVVWEILRFKKKTGYEEKEEKRYQRFKYYLEKPPSESMKQLRKWLDEAEPKIEVYKFSEGIARAYTKISMKIHAGSIKWIARDMKWFFKDENILTAVPILLDQMGVSKKLIQKMKDGSKNEN